ncbi:MAG: GAF domain-containing protein [Anaerolineae bacterium]|nr:GAF domain-containing protein [Anaerolineae bacterium]
MGARTNDAITKVTSELRDEILREQISTDSEVKYRAVPHANVDPHTHPVWRIHLEPTFSSNIRVGLDINGEVTLGRGEEAPGLISLMSNDEAEQLGVSRRHAMLRPTDSQLYLLDLGSTNGTRLNGNSIGVNMPYSLANGDVIALGRLEMSVKIVKRPSGRTGALNTKTDLADVLPSIAKAILSQLSLDDVLKQAMEQAMNYTSADEITVWLVDEQTGELFLEAGRGTDEEQIQRLPVKDSLAGKVIETGKPLRLNRQSDGQIKVKTGYLVDAVIYVPLTLGGVTFGVLSVAHKQPTKSFSSRDEKLAVALADFTAIAVQNARVYQATDNALARRVKVVTALNYALSYDLKKLLNTVVGYSGLMVNDGSLNGEMWDMASRIAEAGNNMAGLIDQLIQITALNKDTLTQHTPCDLIEVVTRAVDDLKRAADARVTRVTYQLSGDPYYIQGDAAQLYRSVYNLVDNAIRYSPPRSQVWVALIFSANDIIIRVCDTGPGIPEEDLPYLFDKYYRGRQTMDGNAGIGLGLELVRATVEAHKGTISVRNGEDYGADFVITLPATLRLS